MIYISDKVTDYMSAQAAEIARLEDENEKLTAKLAEACKYIRMYDGGLNRQAEAFMKSCEELIER